jgi:hypothetical protein
MTRVSPKVPDCLAFFGRRENACRIKPDDTINANSRMSPAGLGCLPETSTSFKESSR